MTTLQTFHLPESVRGDAADHALGQALLRAWRTDGVFQAAASPAQDALTGSATGAARRFFIRPHLAKSALVSDLSYSGYAASGEELTAGEPDRPEIFTVTRDIPRDDPRVRDGWPCHGPVPWPGADFRQAVSAFAAGLGALAETILQLTALGLGLSDPAALTSLTRDGWHHLRVLRFPPAPAGAPTPAGAVRGIGAHTDYGLLVLAVQDGVGGLYVRPPLPGEPRARNWREGESTAGMYEQDAGWIYVPPTPSAITVFPGDILQFLTDGALLSTPHKVQLADRERFALAYFHEPAFDTTLRPLTAAPGAAAETLHYGTHFTRMFTRCYPDRAATRRIQAENRMAVLHRLRAAAVPGVAS
ncbi:2OG-Fe(II) oxygenase family protein [Streptomyces sp. PR69]|uniref:2OG-Fe(II) oxygenase family protein n=1 Tax=Streptomyces sp. PR69 TaxID=2984950 RepID=UPI00226537A6|nr:2OG-Fe(II) oxygenase family protein [Streptomyces sp. PR69]